MEPITQTSASSVEPLETKLFADQVPSMDDIQKLSEFVHSTESNLLNFGQQVEANLGKQSPKSLLAAGIGLYLLGRNAEAIEKLQKAKPSSQVGEENLEDFLDMLEGAVMLEYPDPEGKALPGTPIDLPFFNDHGPDYTPAVSGARKTRVQKEKNGNCLDKNSVSEFKKALKAKETVFLRELISTATRSIDRVPNEWHSPSEWHVAPTLPGIYLFRHKGKIVYVGQAGRRKTGKDLQERLGYHCMGKGASKFREHVIGFVGGKEERNPLDEYLPGIEFTWIEVEAVRPPTDCKEKYIYLGFALRRMGKFDQAIDNLRKSLDCGADTLSITFQIAATYRDAGNFDAAARELKNRANFQNVSAEYHYQLARLQEAQGLYEQAMDNYKIALELAPNHQRALFHLAYRCDLSGDEEAAIEYYAQIASPITGGPVYVSALLNLAVLYEDKGEFDKASECIDIVLASHPNHQRAILFKKDIESSKTMFYDEEKEKKKSRKNQILETPISDFELSVRSRNCLKRMNIVTLGDLVGTSEVELLSYKNFGETSLREIKAILDPKGLRLGTALEPASIEPAETLDHSPIETEEEEIMNKLVDDLQLSVRARKCIQRLNVRTIGDLTHKTEAELLGCKNFGVTSLNEIKKTLNNLGLSLRSLD